MDSESLYTGVPKIIADGEQTADQSQTQSKLLVSSGQPIHQNVKIVNPETLKPCSENQVGEIWVMGDSVAQGYWKNPQATAATFQAFTSDSGDGPFMRTGDLGFLNSGNLYISGRLKEMMIVDGRNLYPQDIEESIQATSPLFRVGCGAVFSLEDESVIAVQEVARRGTKNEVELAKLTKTALQAVNEQHQLALHSLVLIEQGTLLKTSSGKIRRGAMAKLYQDKQLSIIKAFTPKEFIKQDTSYAKKAPIDLNTMPSRLHYEAVLQQLLADELSVSFHDINPHMAFSEFGLESKTLVGLTSALEQKLDRELPAQLFFDYPSIHKLAAYLGSDAASPKPAINRNATTPTSDDIAIVGIGCRFPGQSDSPEAFWQLLIDGKDAITETPASRWNSRDFYDPDILAPGKMITKWGGYLHRVKDFDAAFFGIKEKEATLLDPQQRLLLETSWHALEHAGIPATNTSGRSIGVFLGISNIDYQRHCSRLGASSEPYASTGMAASIAANRLSYFYDWRGPSVAVDTACSSSLVALHQACRSLQQQECDMALAAGVNLILSPDLNITFSKSGMMAPDGRCKTFDDSADGYVRSEGCGVVVLKPLHQAQQQGDNIIAVIKSSAITQDGRSNGITAPNGPAQVQTIERALGNAGLQPGDVQYVECHGTGTALGDPIELNALAQTYGRGRSKPLLVGSVKTNIGHLESAAGIAGVIKTALCLNKQMLPSSLHCHTPNTRFDWTRNTIKVAHENSPWLVPAGTVRRAGVSSFGFGGTNAHLILEEAPSQSTPTEQHDAFVPAQLFCLSAKDRSALQSLINQYLRFLPRANRPMKELCIDQNCSRSHFEERLVLRCSNAEELQENLRSLNWANLEKNVFSSRRRKSQSTPHIIWMFTGQGSQHPGMGRELYLYNAVFRNTIDHCHSLLQLCSGIDLKRFILNESDCELIYRTDHGQPILFCYEYALAQVMLNAGIQPDTLIGHSLGEIVAATIAGVFSLEDGIRVASERGRLMQALAVPGTMMAVFAHKEDVLPLLGNYPLVSIGALNGPGQIVLSGCSQSLQALQVQLEERDIGTRNLTVSHGFHSPLMEPMLGEFRSLLDSLNLKAPRYRLVSNITASAVHEELASADYWCRHVMATVNFQGGLQQVACNQNAILIELGPKPILSAIAQRSLNRDSVRIISSVGDWQQEYQSFLDGIAQCYTSGLNIHWQQFMGVETYLKQDLPLYPFQRKYFWLNDSISSQIAARNNLTEKPFHTLLGQRQLSPHLKNGELHYVTYPGLDSGNWISNLEQQSRIYFHLGHFVEMAMEVGNEAFQTSRLSLQNLELHRRMYAPCGSDNSIHTIAERRANNALKVDFYTLDNAIEVGDQWVLLCSVTITPTKTGKPYSVRSPALELLDTSSTDVSQFFSAATAAQSLYSTSDKNIARSAAMQGDCLICDVDFSELVAESTGQQWLKPDVIQGVYQIIGLFCEALRHNDQIRPGIEYIPYSARSFVWTEHLPAQSTIQITHIESWSDDAEHTELDLAIFNKQGVCTLKIEGMLLRSRALAGKTLAERVREVGMEERVILISTLITESLASSLGGQPMDINLSHSLAELGVDSITAIATLSRLKSELNLDIKASEINRARSIEEFATQLAAKLTPDPMHAETTTQVRGSCAILRAGHPGVLPLFILHTGHEGLLQYLDLANAFGEDIPLLAMLPELKDNDRPHNLDDVIDLLISDIRKEQPHGPYMLCGWSLGATLAVLVANKLVQCGEEIKFVAVIDAPCILGTHLSAQTLQYCIEQITADLTIEGNGGLQQYKSDLFNLYAQTLKVKRRNLSYELRHFQTGTTGNNLVANASAGEWANLSNRKLHSKTIPGDHLSLFKSGNVETLASFLRKLVRSYGAAENRFRRTSLESVNLTQSVLQGIPELNTEKRPSASLLVDEEHPYFFDHELDHIPGILILAGAWELVCRSTFECDPLTPLICRSVSHYSLQFDQFAEKDRDLQYELHFTAGNAFSQQIECLISQSGNTIGRLYLTLDYQHRKPSNLLPGQREVLRGSYDLLHKQIEANVLIDQPEHTETYWISRPQAPEAGHYLSNTTLAYGCLNPIYILESSRQFLTYLSHQQYGVSLGTHVNLIEVTLEFEDAIDFHHELHMVVEPRADTVEQDAFQTITVLWKQNGRTVVRSQITAQVTRQETYIQQRSHKL